MVILISIILLGALVYQLGYRVRPQPEKKSGKSPNKRFKHEMSPEYQPVKERQNEEKPKLEENTDTEKYVTENSP